MTGAKTTTSGSIVPVPQIGVAVCTNAAKTSVEGFFVLPNPASNPVEKQTIEIYLDIRNICNGPLNIPWQINLFGNTVASGVLMNVPAGQLAEAKATWTAAAGTQNFFGYSDFANTLGDAGSDRMTRYMKSVTGYVVRYAPNWPAWGTMAKSGAPAGINAAIAASSILGKRNITGAVAVIYAGDVNGAASFITGPVYAAMVNTPDGVRAAFSDAIKDAWTQYSAAFSLPPGLFSFPQFLVTTNTMIKAAAATPSYVQTAVGVSPGVAAWSTSALAGAVKSRLPAFEAAAPGADAAINDFAAYMSNRFNMWRLAAGQVCTLMGAPVWAPTAVPGSYTASSGTVTGKFCGTF